jgi:hypothetical protein
MAETETITILKVGTDEAVKSIADLRENVKTLKKVIEETQVDTAEGWETYQNALNELKVNQNALKDAMYATSGSFEDVAKAATGTSESYNSLVHRMAALKEEFRSTEDAMRRAEIGGQIKAINDQLKDMDALQGNFQRNVGNYANSIKDAFSDMSVNVDVFRKSLGAVGGGLNGLKDGMEGIAKSPFIATFGLLVSLAFKLADELKDNETAMAAIKKAMGALQPVMDLFSGIIEKIAEYLADIISKVTEFVTSNGLMQKIIKGVMGVGNAILKFIIAPFKGIAAAIKVFQEEGVKGLGNAARAFGQEMKSGVAFKENFSAGQVAADTLLSGVKSRKKAAKEAGKALGKEVGKGLAEELNGILDKIDKDWDKKQQDRLKLHEKRQKEIADYLKKANEDFLKEQEEEADAAADAWLESYKKQEEAAKKTAQAKKDTLKGVADATSSILGTIADLYEDDEENSEKNANKVKNLRIAAATIDTISGAIGAFMQASQTIPPPYGQIVGAAAAAAVTASGLAQIAQLKKTKVSGSAGNSHATTPAVSSAPTINPNVSNVRSVTSASEEERLNQMASSQRVYILASDIEASQNQIKTQVSESSF